jgi:glucosyl-3-phosphoglycerate synthase
MLSGAMGDDRSTPAAPLTLGRDAYPLDEVLAAKRDRTISVCIPARDEAATVGGVVAAVRPHLAEGGGSGLVDQVLVVDDGSCDATGAVARSAGAEVLVLRGSGGKGQAMRAAVEASSGEFIVFLDADVENTTPEFVTALAAPLLLAPQVALVKGFYERPLHGEATGGGRVTELVARPLIELCFPELRAIRQPLAGETAAARWVLEKFSFADGYGVEFGLLVDVGRALGVRAIAQVDLGVRVHRNRPLDELRPQAAAIMAAAFDRARSDPRAAVPDAPRADA